MINIGISFQNGRRSLFVAFLVLLFAAAPTGATAQMTADKVHDEESLKAFVIHATQYLASLRDYNDVIATRTTFRQRPKWSSGDTYLIMIMHDGSVGLHAGNRAFQGRNVLDMRDDRGVAVVRQMVKVAEAGGGFVPYVDGEPKVAYAAKFLTGVGDIGGYLVGGYSMDLSQAPVTAGIKIPKPSVTAAEVVDKETLVAFVEAAADAYRRAYESDNRGDILAVRNAFRRKGSHWRDGSIYLWLAGSKGIILFHATEQFREGKPFNMERVDINGLPFVKLMIDGALREGRKFLRYYYDDPEIHGDEDIGSPKFGYAVSFNARKSDQRVVVGSGIYLKSVKQK